MLGAGVLAAESLPAGSVTAIGTPEAAEVEGDGPWKGSVAVLDGTADIGCAEGGK